MAKRQYYKILLRNGRAPVSRMPWSLPFKDKRGRQQPGGWHTVIGRLAMCRSGLHVVSEPDCIRRWLKFDSSSTTTNRRLFLAETHGPTRRRSSYDADKYLYRTVRLVREIKQGTVEWDLVVFGRKK